MTPPAPPASHPGYRPDIDGLRAIAVLSVLAYHAFPQYLTGGFLGVDVFFVISGFLISTIIFESLDRGTFRFGAFYARRIRRIFPALLLVLTVCLAAGWPLLFADEYAQLGKHIGGGAGFVSNLVLWSEAGYFDDAAEVKPLLHLWSLGIEEQFYIVWPLLVWMAWQRRFNPAIVIGSVAAISFALNIAQVGGAPVAAFYSPLTRFWELLAGSLLAWAMLARRRGGEAALPDPPSRPIDASAATISGPNPAADLLSVAGICLLGFGFWHVDKAFLFPGYWALVPVLGAVLLIVAGPRAWVNRRVQSNRLAIWFGVISYPLYLWHWPLLSFARIIEGEQPSWRIRLAAVAVSIALAWLTCRFIEAPLRFGGYARTKIVALVCSMFVLGSLGYGVLQHDGIASRPIARLGEVITAARADWRFEPTLMADGQITGIHRREGARRDAVLFVGSSLMGQYFPRIERLYAEGRPALSTVFAARNHCTPIPMFTMISTPDGIDCRDYYRAALALADDAEVVTVVFGGQWPNLFVDGHPTEQARAFIADLNALVAAGKQVFLIADPPFDSGLDPLAAAKPLRLGRATTLADASLDRDRLQNRAALAQIERLASQTGAGVIDPFDWLCTARACPVVRDGRPLYHDFLHIRADFAASDARFIDALLTPAASPSAPPARAPELVAR
ncbi:MAG: acyltransferase family protein [Burkholderiaceae bacterium]